MSVNQEGEGPLPRGKYADYLNVCSVILTDGHLSGHEDQQPWAWPQEAILKIYISLTTKMETAKLFKNGQSQAVRLPKEFRFQGDKVFIKRVGNAVVLLPYQDSWQSLFESLHQFSDDFMAVREQPVQQRESAFE